MTPVFGIGDCTRPTLSFQTDMISASLRKQLLTVGTGMAGGRTLAFLQGIVIARLLGPVDLGKYVAMMTVCSILSRLGDFGLAHAFSYFARTTQDSLGAMFRILAFHSIISLVFSAVALFTDFKKYVMFENLWYFLGFPYEDAFACPQTRTADPDW